MSYPKHKITQELIKQLQLDSFLDGIDDMYDDTVRVSKPIIKNPSELIVGDKYIFFISNFQHEYNDLYRIINPNIKNVLKRNYEGITFKYTGQDNIHDYVFIPETNMQQGQMGRMPQVTLRFLKHFDAFVETGISCFIRVETFTDVDRKGGTKRKKRTLRGKRRRRRHSVTRRKHT